MMVYEPFLIFLIIYFALPVFAIIKHYYHGLKEKKIETYYVLNEMYN